MKAVVIALILACVTCEAWADDCTDPLVKKPEDAGRIAFAMWHVVNPNFTATDERKWLPGFTTSLYDCVWSVAAKPEPPRDYSTFVISIGAKDVRYSGARISD